MAVVIPVISSVRRAITNDQRLKVFTSPALSTISSHFTTMQSFASRQHCLLTLAFQSTHQIVLCHSQGLLSLQARLLLFWVSAIFQSLFDLVLFPFLPFFFPNSYISWYSNIDDYPLLFCLFNYNNVCSSCLYHVVTLNIDIPQHFYLFLHFLLVLLGCAHTTFLCVLTHSPYKSPDGFFFATLSCLVLYYLRQFITST